jgi:Restriction endonuclease
MPHQFGRSWMVRPGRALEQLVAELERVLGPTDVVITSPDKIVGKLSNQEREVDVSLRARVGSARVLVIIECRDRQGAQDVRWVEELATKREDVGADKAIAVSPTGFSTAAKNMARALGIDLRTFADVTAADVFRWLSLNTVTVRVRHIEFTMFRFGVGADGLQPGAEVVSALSAPDAASAKILRRKSDARPTSMDEVWKTLPKGELFEDLPPDTRKPVTLNLAFHDPDDRYQIMTTDGIRDVADAEISGQIWYEEQEVPLTRYFEYLGEAGALVQSAEVELEQEGSRIAFGLNATSDRSAFSLTTRRLDDSERTVYADVGIEFAVEENEKEG